MSHPTQSETKHDSELLYKLQGILNLVESNTYLVGNDVRQRNRQRMDVGDEAETITGHWSTINAGYHSFAVAGSWSKVTIKDNSAAAAGHLGTVFAGHNAVVYAGTHGTATARDGSLAITDNWGTAIVGNNSTAVTGNWGSSIAGDDGVAITGALGKASAGERGIIYIAVNHSSDQKVVGYVGEDGILPNTLYELNSHRMLVEATIKMTDYEHYRRARS